MALKDKARLVTEPDFETAAALAARLSKAYRCCLMTGGFVQQLYGGRKAGTYDIDLVIPWNTVEDLGYALERHLPDLPGVLHRSFIAEEIWAEYDNQAAPMTGLAEIQCDDGLLLQVVGKALPNCNHLITYGPDSSGKISSTFNHDVFCTTVLKSFPLNCAQVGVPFADGKRMAPCIGTTAWDTFMTTGVVTKTSPEWNTQTGAVIERFYAKYRTYYMDGYTWML